jgi:hypothetical protein
MAAVPIERVSVLLGHQSVRVTDRLYAPWVGACQEQLQADVRRKWDLRIVQAQGARATPALQLVVESNKGKLVLEGGVEPPRRVTGGRF